MKAPGVNPLVHSCFVVLVVLVSSWAAPHSHQNAQSFGGVQFLNPYHGDPPADSDPAMQDDHAFHHRRFVYTSKSSLPGSLEHPQPSRDSHGSGKPHDGWAQKVEQRLLLYLREGQKHQARQLDERLAALDRDRGHTLRQLQRLYHHVNEEVQLGREAGEDRAAAMENLRGEVQQQSEQLEAVRLSVTSLQDTVDSLVDLTKRLVEWHEDNNGSDVTTDGSRDDGDRDPYVPPPVRNSSVPVRPRFPIGE